MDDVGRQADRQTGRCVLTGSIIAAALIGWHMNAPPDARPPPLGNFYSFCYSDSVVIIAPRSIWSATYAAVRCIKKGDKKRKMKKHVALRVRGGGGTACCLQCHASAFFILLSIFVKSFNGAAAKRLFFTPISDMSRSFTLGTAAVAVAAAAAALQQT